MRSRTIFALAVAAPLFIASGGAPAAAGGWRDCPPVAYYSAPVRAYRYSYYAPARPYYYSYRSYEYAYRPRIVGYGPPPYYRYRRPFAYYSAYSYGWSPSVSIAIGY